MQATTATLPSDGCLNNSLPMLFLNEFQGLRIS